MPVIAKERRFFENLFKKINDSPDALPVEKTLAATRADVASIIWLVKKPAAPDYIEEVVIARDGHHIPVRVFNAHLSPEAPVLFYLLGNGFIFDQFEVSTLIAARIAAHSGCKVIMVNPRLAPEHPLPGPIEDFYDVIQTLLTRQHAIVLKPRHTTVVGYCSGASAACAVVAMGNRREFQVDHLILLNGIYDLTFQSRDYAADEAQDVSFDPMFMEIIARAQNVDDTYKRNPWYSPVYNDDFSRYPPTTILVAECDRNRSSSEALYRKMAGRGASVIKMVLPGQTHNTLIFYESIKAGKDPAQVIAKAALSQMGQVR